MSDTDSPDKEATDRLRLNPDSLPSGQQLEADRARLRQSLQEFCAESTLHGRFHSFARLVNWTRSDGNPASRSESNERVNELLSLLETDNGIGVAFQKAFHEMLGATQGVTLFAEAGLHPRESLWSELARRAVERILPSAREDADLSKLILLLHPDDRYISRFLEWPEELFRRTVRVLSPGDNSSVWNRQKKIFDKQSYSWQLMWRVWACRQNVERGLTPTLSKNRRFTEFSAWPANWCEAVQSRSRKACWWHCEKRQLFAGRNLNTCTSAWRRQA